MGMQADHWVLGVGELVVHEPEENSLDLVDEEGLRRKAAVALGMFGPVAFGARSAVQPVRGAAGGLVGTQRTKQACGICNCPGLDPVVGCHPKCVVGEETLEIVCGAVGIVPRGLRWGEASFKTRLLNVGETEVYAT